MGKNWRRSGLCVVAAALLFAGCKKDEVVDYSIEGEMEQHTEEAWQKGTAGVGQFADAGQWMENFHVQKANGEYVNVVIEADVSVPDVDEMYIVSVEEKEFTQEEEKRIAEKLLDEGSIEEKKNGYRGQRDGINYTLTFDSTETRTRCYERTMTLTYNDLESICPKDLRGTENLGMMVGMDSKLAEKENLCGLDEETAIEQAGELLQQLGFEYAAYAYTMPIAWGTTEQLGWVNYADSTACYIDGYAIRYDLGLENISFCEFGAEDSYGEARYTTSENSIYSMNSYAVVQIVDSGVVAVEIRNPVTVQSISNPVRLLSLDTVKDIMLSQFEKNYDSFHLKGNFLKKMQLIYFRMTDREHKGCYSYVPVWRLSDGSIYTLPGDYQVIGMGDEIMINAVDGSVVRFSEEFMGEEAQEK